MSLITAKKVNLSKTMAPIKIGTAIIFCIFFGSQIFKSQVRSNKIIWAILLLWAFIWFIRSIRRFFLFNNMYKIDAAIASCEEKIIPVFTVADKVGLSEKKTLRLIKKYIKKKYFHDCTIETEGNPRIIITVTTEDGFDETEVICPECGAAFTAKAGTAARCPECAVMINV